MRRTRPSGALVLEIDDFGMSLGSLSIGLPTARTAEDVYSRYLELLRLTGDGSTPVLEPSEDDVVTLARATSRDPAYVAERLDALR